MPRDKFVALCQHIVREPLIHWRWGLDVDYDGGYEGQGVIVYVDWPKFLQRWANGFLPPPPKSDRTDISDALLSTMYPMVNVLGMISSPHPAATATWSDDALSE